MLRLIVAIAAGILLALLIWAVFIRDDVESALALFT
jgi:hypothetical protein